MAHFGLKKKNIKKHCLLPFPFFVSEFCPMLTWEVENLLNENIGYRMASVSFLSLFPQSTRSNPWALSNEMNLLCKELRTWIHSQSHWQSHESWERVLYLHGIPATAIVLPSLSAGLGYWSSPLCFSRGVMGRIQWSIGEERCQLDNPIKLEVRRVTVSLNTAGFR